MIVVGRSQGQIKIVQKDSGKVKVLATLSAEDANRVALSLLKSAAIVGSIKELKGMTHEESYH